MKGKNIITLATAIIMTAWPLCGNAAVSSFDPLWQKAVMDGYPKVNNEINTQTTKMVEIAALQNTMALHFNAIMTWQSKYNSYLKTAQGYGERLKATTTLYGDAILTMRNLQDLRKAMSENPEGIASTIVINNLYLEVLTQFIKTFRMLKYSVATGGKYNMLTGKERTEMLWALVDQVEDMNKKIKMLTLSVYYYRLKDIWAIYTRGIIPLDKTTIVNRCFDNWNRAHSVINRRFS